MARRNIDLLEAKVEYNIKEYTQTGPGNNGVRARRLSTQSQDYEANPAFISGY
jgi:hypothetical protein